MPRAAMTLLAAENLTRVYPVRAGLRRTIPLYAVSDVSFTLSPSRTLAIVGESGCGKSTLARMITLLERPTSGAVKIDDRPADATDQATRRDVQMVFQDPYGSLNPRRTVGQILEEPLVIAGIPAIERRAAAQAMMARVGLRLEQAARYPHMFSGGQRQRIAIARALMLRPRIIVADEPVSALDVSVRAQVLNLLLDLQQELGQAYLFISHDLSVVRHIADDVLVMYLGRVVEQAPRDTLFAHPRHPYTRALLAATPGLRGAPTTEPVRGEPPSPLTPPAGCAYHTRCPHATPLCREARPLLRNVDETQVACHHAETVR
ncbi:MAG TPA: dipeptide ABC transporter ATP-binding protein [Acetobacteraceae bacterium]|jgi:dipeptide transport system ATP-binding protein|nr:dipeptide ABC transporter ATP-binding protein [Acetobacteraceae bacterium]